MKRLFILLLFAGIAANLFSQKKFVRRASLYLESDLEKTKEHLDSAVKYQENREWAKLWYTYAEYCMKVYDKNPEAIVDGKNPLVKAYECFKKTKETDDKGRYENDLKLKGQILYSKLVNMGVQGFNASDYKKALDGFEYAIKLKDMPYLKGVDTAVIYNAGLAAYNSGDYEKAEKYINRAKDLGYQLKNSFSLLNDIYMNKLNDTTKALETLKEGYEKMPENTAFLIEIINHYLINEEAEKALEYIDIAKEKEPDNATLFFAEGTLYEQLEKPEKALKSYESALNKKPNYFDALFNTGIIYYNKAAAIIKDAQDIPTNEDKKYQKEIDKAKNIFKKAIPYLTKAYNNSDESALKDKRKTVTALKEIYYRLRNDDPKYKEKFEKFKNEFDKLNKGSNKKDTPEQN